MSSPRHAFTLVVLLLCSSAPAVGGVPALTRSQRAIFYGSAYIAIVLLGSVTVFERRDFR